MQNSCCLIKNLYICILINCITNQKEVYMPKTNKRKYLKISNTVSKIVLLFFLLSFGTVKNLNAAWQGSGTEADPWQITSRECLEALADSVNNGFHWSSGKYFKLMNDITDSVRTVIGVWTGTVVAERAFKGNFDGQNHTIILAINNVNTQCVGLFGYISSDVLSNAIEIKNIVVDGYVNGIAAGGVAGSVFGMHANSIGITIINCVNNSKVTGEIVAAGITAYITNGVSVSNVVNLGAVKATTAVAGGVVGGMGFNNSSAMPTVTNSSNYGFVYSDNNAGGVVGEVFALPNAPATISNNFNSGIVEGVGNIGCIVGFIFNNNSATLINNHYDKQMCGEED